LLELELLELLLVMSLTRDPPPPPQAVRISPKDKVAASLNVLDLMVFICMISSWLPDLPFNSVAVAGGQASPYVRGLRIQQSASLLIVGGRTLWFAWLIFLILPKTHAFRSLT